MADCPFCKIASGIRNEGPKDFRWLENSMAFTPLRPHAPGHTLVVPIEHHESILDVDPDTLREVMEDAAELGQKLVNDGADGVNVLTSAGHAATQSVMHWHVHVIPRRSGDELGAWPWIPSSERLEALEEIRQRVADGWCAWPAADVKGQGAWRCIYSERDDKDIRPEVAAVLWPSTEEDVVTQSERQEDR